MTLFKLPHRRETDDCTHCGREPEFADDVDAFVCHRTDGWMCQLCFEDNWYKHEPLEWLDDEVLQWVREALTEEEGEAEERTEYDSLAFTTRCK